MEHYNGIEKDMTYPKTLNQIQMKQGKIPTYIQEVPEEPKEEQIENVKRKMIAEFQNVFSDEVKTIRPILCIAAEIIVVPKVIPIRISTAGRLAYAFRDETKGNEVE